MITATLYIVFGLAVIVGVVWMFRKPPADTDGLTALVILVIIGLVIWGGVVLVGKGIDRIKEVEDRQQAPGGST